MKGRTDLRGPAAGLTLLLLALALFAKPARAASDDIDPWVYGHAGLDHFYNVEYEPAIAQLQKAIEADPQNQHFYNYLAHTYLFQELHRLGKLEGNLYDASNAFLKEEKREPDPAEIARFKEWLGRARQLCKARLEKNPRDADALYSLGAAYGIEANYLFTMEKKYLDALGAAGKANDLHEKVLKLDPSYHDAKLIPGLYQYVVGSIPRSVRWLAFLFGYRGSKERGIRLLQETMVHGKYVSSDAAFMLAVIYNREKRFDYSRQLFEKLSEYYPRNPLVRLEVGRTYSRQGNSQEALRHYVAVAEDMEAGKFGPGKLPRDRLWYQVGTLQQQLGQFREALEAYARITERNDSDGVLKAYAHLRRAEAFLAFNRPDCARAEYERMAALPYEEPRRQAEERLRALGNYQTAEKASGCDSKELLQQPAGTRP